MDYDFRISWSDNALNDLDNILDYLREQWTQKELENFKKILFNRIDLIGKYPKLFRPSIAKPQLRRLVLTKQTSIYYHVHPGQAQVTMVRLFDNRMDLNKL